VSRRAALAGAALLAIAGAVLAVVLVPGSDSSSSASGALATERERRASGIEIAPDERLLWGNLVVRAARDEEVELVDVELLGASEGLRLRRALVADGQRPQARLLVFGERAFERLPNVDAWRRSLHPLAGYRVERDAGRFRDTEIVLEFEPVGEGTFQVRRGVRLQYRVGDAEGAIRLPNQLSVCAPSPCKPPRPVGF
jgi:hypothetical protein